jgi:hypothetical protein
MSNLEELIRVYINVAECSGEIDPDDQLIAAARAEQAELIDALLGCVTQLSPGCVPVVIHPQVEPFSIAVARRILKRFPAPETAAVDSAPSTSDYQG